MKISIAMATYNGAKYLQEQLDSLARQTFLPMELVVGDDRSTDATLDIIEKFSRKAPFPVHVRKNENTFGFGRNFLSTAKRCQGDWVAFCDQDDVWLPNKLEDVAWALDYIPGRTLLLQYASLCDQELFVKKTPFPNHLTPGVKERQSQYGFWVWPGFLQTVSKEVISLWDGGDLPKSNHNKKSEISHDVWSCMVANSLGGVYVLDNISALYRRHDSALTGKYSQLSLFRSFKKSTEISSEHYDFLVGAANDFAVHLEHLAHNMSDPLRSSSLHEGSAGFRKISNIQRLRSQLYGDPRMGIRLWAFWTIFKEGGYIGDSFHAMGLRSVMKDMIFLIGGFRK